MITIKRACFFKIGKEWAASIKNKIQILIESFPFSKLLKRDNLHIKISFNRYFKENKR